jgi:alpha-glucosidase
MNAAGAGFEFGAVRVQVLGPHLVRVEQRGAAGFEDRETFTVRERTAVPVKVEVFREAGAAVVAAPDFRVAVPDGAAGIEGVRIESAAGELRCVLSNAMRRPVDLPSPSALPAVWVLGDHPRVVPPPWGALPPPEGTSDPASGWDLANDAPDAYVFFPAASGYERFRSDFLRVTGAVPLVPLHTLGLWYSRYHDYGEEEALAVIDRFRSAGIPLDLFVVDTDWRVGGSSGYEINKALFPDMARFTARARERRVRIMLNDHPEPKGTHALDPAELRFRRDGLVSLLEKGVDAWWFDRNWHTHLQAPAPGLEKEVWGMRLYRDVTADFAPERRPLVLSNADGIGNGWRTGPSHPAAHRFPVWWTGDTRASWRYLRMGVANSVDWAILALLPYVHEDLGGHHDQPDEDLYVRFMQFGAFSPVARIHCTKGVHRYPWEYGGRAERIIGDFFRLRYRLLPMLYAAAVAAHRSGTPLLRRGDLEWPEYPEAADSSQFLLGDDLLVAPILAPAEADGLSRRAVWIPPGDWQDAWTGRIHRGPAVIGAACPLTAIPIYIRRGGIVFHIPQRDSTGEAVWPELVAEAFAPLADGRQVRTFHEDDGWSIAHETGQTAATSVELSRNGDPLKLTVRPQAAPEGIRPAQRAWTLRLHLPPGAAAGAVRLDGRKLGAEEFTVLPPAETPSTRLFEGPGSPPPPQDGPVVEWRGDRPTNAPLDLAVEMVRRP